jgi:hypothetical protein
MGRKPTVTGTEEGCRLSLYIPVSLYDAIYSASSDEKLSMNEIVRKALRKYLK